MSLPSKIHIGWQNDLEAMTLTASASAEALHPISNIANGIKGIPSRWASTSALTIYGTSASDMTASMFLLKGHNLAAADTVRLRLYDSASQAGAVVYDSDDIAGAGAIYIQKAWGEMIAGIDPWGNYYDPSSNLDAVYSLAFPAVAYKSFRFDISLDSAAIVSLDQMAICYSWTPEFNFEYDSEMGVVDRSQHTDTRAGGIRTTKYPARRILSGEFALMSDADSNILMEIETTATKAGNLYVAANPNANGYSKFISTSIFKRDHSATVRQRFFNLRSKNFVLREN